MRTGTAVELVLLVPGLLGPVAARSEDREAAQALVAGLDLGGLDRLLARASHTAGSTSEESLEVLAFRMFGHPAPIAGTDWPVAALTAPVDGGAEPGRGFLLRADPVHLRADISDLVLFDAAQIDLSPPEAEALARTVNDALDPHGPRLDASHPHRWYVALDAPVRIVTTPLSRVVGAGISEALPRGPDAARWHRWMNEVQMALHECPVNVERERRGAAPINSVWVWGAGSLPSAGDAPAPFVGVWTDDVLLRGLARHFGVKGGANPVGARDWLDRSPRSGTHLVVFDDLYPAMRHADLDAWREGVARLSRAWARPLLDALNRGRISQVVIQDERSNRFTATRGGRFRWWRRAGLAAKITGAHGPDA